MSEEKSNFYILLATPCYGGQMFRGYTQSILNLQRLCDSNGIKLDILTIGNESLITRARNFYVSLALAKKEYTHLFFVDSDISFNPLNVIRMLTSDKDVVAGCYPKKGINWEKVSNIIKEGTIEKEFYEAASYDYAVNIITENDQGTQKIPIQNGFMKVAYAATGFMMIKRNVLENMAREYSNLKYVNDVGGYDVQGNKDYFYALFDCIIDPVSRRYLSEDYAFCKRWLGMGGEIWVDLSCNLSHTGSYDFKGAFLKSIEKGIKSDQNQVQKTDKVSSEMSVEDKLKMLLGNKKEESTQDLSLSVEEKLKMLLGKKDEPKKISSEMSIEDKLQMLLSNKKEEPKPVSSEKSIEDKLKMLLSNNKKEDPPKVSLEMSIEEKLKMLLSNNKKEEPLKVSSEMSIEDKLRSLLSKNKFNSSSII